MDYRPEPVLTARGQSMIKETRAFPSLLRRHSARPDRRVTLQQARWLCHLVPVSRRPARPAWHSAAPQPATTLSEVDPPAEKTAGFGGGASGRRRPRGAQHGDGAVYSFPAAVHISGRGGRGTHQQHIGTDAAHGRPVAQDHFRQPQPQRGTRCFTFTHRSADMQAPAAPCAGLPHRCSAMPPPSGSRAFSASVGPPTT
jgi:hypothetical protein